MGFNYGIVGLPNVGKSTLFNAITSGSAPAENYPFCTIDPNIGIVAIPDHRLGKIAAVYGSPVSTPTTIEFVDIAGLVAGASKGDGLGNQFLAHIREVKAICHVVRCFDDENVLHTYGTVDPVRDIEIVETELILKDLETVERKLAETEKKAKSGDRKLRVEVDFYARLRDHLRAGQRAISEQPESPDEVLQLRELHLLTTKPVMYVCNVDETAIGGSSMEVEKVREIAHKETAEVVVVCSKMEAEIAAMPYDEREKFLADLGVSSSGLDQVIHAGYRLLDLVTFFTSGTKETRAWTVKRGSTAPRAAGEVHTDFEHGFIKAEVITFDDLMSCGSVHAVREKGLMRMEGRDYVVQDGDILFFRFHI